MRVRCPICQGTGKVPYTFAGDGPVDSSGQKQCPGCNGTGMQEEGGHYTPPKKEKKEEKKRGPKSPDELLRDLPRQFRG